MTESRRRMMSGYCYELTDEMDFPDWETAIYTPTGEERFLFCREIDGAKCAVFACPDGMFRAQLAIGRAAREEARDE